jgi:hypothetical protein
MDQSSSGNFMKNSSTTIALAVAGSIAVTTPVPAKSIKETEQQVYSSPHFKFKVGSGFDYSVGDYGQSQNTSIWYVPVSGKVEMDNWAFKLTMPWIRIKGPGAVIGGGDTGGSSVVSSGGATVTTESGLGDIVSALTYMINLPEKTYVDLTGKIKFPTADEKKGLGTGKTDYTFQADATKIFGAFSVFGGVGYKFVGSDDTLNLHDVWLMNAGVGYDVTPQVNAGIAYDWHQAASDTAENPSEATLYMGYKATKDINVQVYGVTGFSDGSPNWGGGMMVGFKF